MSDKVNPYLNGFQTLIVQVAQFNSGPNVKYVKLGTGEKPICATEFAAYYPNMFVHPNGEHTQQGDKQERINCSIVKAGSGKRVEEGICYRITCYRESRQGKPKTVTSVNETTGVTEKADRAGDWYITYKVVGIVKVDTPDWWPTWTGSFIDVECDSNIEDVPASEFLARPKKDNKAGGITETSASDVTTV